MPYKKIIKTIPFEADEVYNIILDVEKYHQFLPYCKGVNVDFKSQNEILATMKLEIPTPLKKIHIQYQSHIEANQFTHTILINSTQKDKFFRFMKSHWHIKPCIAGCEITYEMSFELQNPLLNLALSSLFLHHSQNVVDAFIVRANKILKPVV